MAYSNDEAILLDTHIALWLSEGNRRLGPQTQAFIDDHWRDGGTFLLSAVSAWEIAQLVDTQRIRLDLSVEQWIDRFVSHTGIKPTPLTTTAAVRSYQLHPLEHRDPGDRLLIATAIELACRFITYDAKIVAFAEQHGERYGLRLAG